MNTVNAFIYRRIDVFSKKLTLDALRKLAVLVLLCELVDITARIKTT
jgi:hypothetical protein